MSNPKRPVSTVEEFIKVFHEMSARYGHSELWYDYMAVRLLDGVSRRGVVKDLEDFRDKWRHYNEQAAAESQVILDKISELFEKDGDSK